MNLFKKVNKKVTPVAQAQEATPTVPVNGAGRPVKSYRTVLFEECDRRTKPLEAEIKAIEAKQQDLRNLGQGRSDEIAEAHRQLDQRKEELRKKLHKTSVDYQPSPILAALASDLDHADRINEGARIIAQLHNKIEAMAPLIDRAATCYGGSIYEPLTLATIREFVLGTLRARANNAIGPVRQVDKAAAEAEFNAAFAEYQQRVKERDAMTTALDEMKNAAPK